MSASLGIGLAVFAMIFWGLGDFMIQRSARKVGDWETLFVVSFLGSIILLPFVYKSIPAIFSNPEGFLVLSGCAVLLFVALLLDFESVRIGKLSVIEPVWSFEIPTAAILAFFILGERLSLVQIGFIALLIVGLALVSFKGRLRASMLLEEGVIIAFIAALVMGSANFFVGWGARLTDPLMVNFFANVIIAFGSFLYLLGTGRIRKLRNDFIVYKQLLLPMALADNAAWIAFAFSMTLVPIGIVVALSESYVLIAVCLGIFINKEQLCTRQKVGLVVALGAAIILAVLTA